jgi:hypothetical protein
MVLAVSSWWLPTSEVHAKPPARACQNTHYTVVEVPLLPEVISPSGVVAGVTEAHRAALWRRESGVQELPVPDGFHYTDPVAITESGSVVINASDAQARKRGAFVYSKGSFIALAGNQTLAHGVSPSGLIVGEWVPDGKTTSAVYWNKNLPHALGLCCGGAIKAANRAGELIGDAYDAQGHYHAFAWSQSGGQRMVGPPDRYSSAVAIDAAGRILLQVGSEGYLERKGRSMQGQLQRLDLSAKLYNSIHGMNNCDFVVGGYGPDSEHYRAFLWTAAAGFQDLNSLIAADSGWTLESALAINDRGEIVGRGDFHHNDTGFALIPRP